MKNLQAIMPLDMYIMFPDGASLNENGVVQVDSNAELSGGVSPDIRVPLNEETVAGVLALYMGVDAVINEIYGSRILPVWYLF